MFGTILFLGKRVSICPRIFSVLFPTNFRNMTSTMPGELTESVYAFAHSNVNTKPGLRQAHSNPEFEGPNVIYGLLSKA